MPNADRARLAWSAPERRELRGRRRRPPVIKKKDEVKVLPVPHVEEKESIIKKDNDDLQ
jgi:hypothetical protein